MNPNTPQPSFELPALPGESGANDEKKEVLSPKPETYTRPVQPVSTAPGPPVHPQQVTPVSHPVDPMAQVGQTTQVSPVMADDNDLIEKEWVQKAKQIVASTKDDPYTQSKELNKFKADYVKKRYNKNLKTEEI